MKEVRYPKLRELLLMSVGNRSQSEVSRWCLVSQSAVSDWMNGYDRPGRAHIALLSLFLPIDASVLAEAAGYEPNDIVHLATMLSVGPKSFDDLVESQYEQVKQIRKLWSGGSPREAVEIGTMLDTRLEEELERYVSSEHHTTLLELRSELLVELASSYSVALVPSDAVIQMNRIVEQQEAIAHELPKSAKPVALAAHTMGDAGYIQGEYAQSYQWFKRSRESEKDKTRQIEIVRAMTLDAAYLKDTRQFEKRVAELEAALDKLHVSNPIDQSLIVEAIGRGKALLGRADAVKTLEQDASLVAKAEAKGLSAIYRKLQLRRSQFLASLALEGDGVGHERIETEGNEIRLFAAEHGYFKYADEIARIQDRFLN